MTNFPIWKRLWKKRSLRIFTYLLVIISLERFCHYQTGGFRPWRLYSDYPYNPAWEVPKEALPSSIDWDQPFTFLGKGGQSYAFLSPDQTIVLKVFKIHHRSPLHLWKYLALFSPLENLYQKVLDLKVEKELRALNSFHIAFADLKEETGLLYLHLNPTDFLHQTVTLRDKLGVPHLIDLDHIPFALQKRATLPKPTLRKLMKEGKTQEAKQLLDSMLLFLKKRSQKGIADRDPIIEKNFGFLEGQAIEIDLGSFFRDPSLCHSQKAKRDLFFTTLKWKNWLLDRYPELGLYFEDQVQAFLTAEEIN
jgi:hypothetical protein